MTIIMEYDWPGNVRELENMIGRAAILAEGRSLTPEDLPKNLSEGSSLLVKRGVKDRKSLDEIKADYICEILKETNCNKRIAAEILKVNPRTLYRFEKKNQAD